jgi:hypothetical protein
MYKIKYSQPMTSGLVRIFAAGVLLVWLAAFTHCSTECLAGDSDSYSQAEHSHPAAEPSTRSHDSDKHGSHDDSFCIALHSICPVSTDSVLAKPDFGLACPLNFVSTAQFAALTPPEALVSRQPPDREWVFTPEVSLGPAFRSLAPPLTV